VLRCMSDTSIANKESKLENKEEPVPRVKQASETKTQVTKDTLRANISTSQECVEELPSIPPVQTTVRPFFIVADETKTVLELRTELTKLKVPIDDCFDKASLMERLKTVKDHDRKKGLASRFIEHNWKQEWEDPTNWTSETHQLLNTHGLLWKNLHHIVRSAYPRTSFLPFRRDFPQNSRQELPPRYSPASQRDLGDLANILKQFSSMEVDVLIQPNFSTENKTDKSRDSRRGTDSDNSSSSSPKITIKLEEGQRRTLPKEIREEAQRIKARRKRKSVPKKKDSEKDE